MEVFFYGLFMDANLLTKYGIKFEMPRKGYIENYMLKIGKRASLIPCRNERSYGIVMTVDQKALQKLYAEPSVSDYLPETVDVIISSSQMVRATCYNLPAAALTGTNESYAASLYQLAKKFGFPDDYLLKIQKMAKKIP